MFGRMTYDELDELDIERAEGEGMILRPKPAEDDAGATPATDGSTCADSC